MKKLTVMTIVLALLLAVASVVCATEAQPETSNVVKTTITASEVKEDNTVTVTVKLNKAVNQWDFTVKYNKAVLEFVEADTNDFEHAEGTRFVGNATKAKDTFTITFKAVEGAEVKTTELSVIEAKSFGSRNGSEKTSYEVEVGAPATVNVVKEEVKTYTVTFKDYDEKVLKTETVEEGKGATAPADPTREGYKFVGWDKDFSKVTGDLVVTAKYEEVKVDTGDDNKGEEDNKGGEAGQKPAEPAEPSTSDDDDEMDQTGMNMVYVGIIAAVVIAGAVVLIKRK